MIEHLTISLTRYNEPNLILKQSLISLSNKQDVRAEVLFYDQQDDPEIRQFLINLNTDFIKFVYITIPANGLSFARNEALKASVYNIVLFIDSDAIADQYWAKNILKTFSCNSNAAIVGGKISPIWHRKPFVLARSLIVREHYSILDLGDNEISTPKIVGASFGIHRSRLGSQAYFNEKLGRRDGRLMGGEETDLCKRCLQAGWDIYYNGKSIVKHQILPNRITYHWIFKRLYFAGVHRGYTGGMPSPTHKMDIWGYFALPFILPWYLIGMLKGFLMRRF